jgi:CRISPR-associated protein Csy2
MSDITQMPTTKALLVLPHLLVQNANAISSPLTHGFPSITAFTGFMWALQRKITAEGLPLLLEQVGVICHRHEEQVTDGYVKTFRLTRNPVDKDGKTAALVEEGRIHLDITVVFQVTLRATHTTKPTLLPGSDEQHAGWADLVGKMVSQMRIAGGTLLPERPMRGRRTRPWMEVISDDTEKQEQAFLRWRRQWLPGYALVGRDDLLAKRLQTLRTEKPDATILDAWLHASRFNYQAVPNEASDNHAPHGSSKKHRWTDPARQSGAGWTVPIPVGYVALTKPMPGGTVTNARDAITPCVFVESIYSLGEWISLHRLRYPHQLMWRPEYDADTGVYRCRSGFGRSDSESALADEELPDYD